MHKNRKQTRDTKFEARKLFSGKKEATKNLKKMQTT